MKKYYLFIFIILATFSASPIYADTTANSGFIPGQIWYSAELVQGETVNIHTAVWNGEKSPISAKVEFYDKNVILGSRDVTLASLELKDVFIPWKVTSGDHTISAKITSSITTVSGKKEQVVLNRNATSSYKQFVPALVKDEEGNVVSGPNAMKKTIGETSSKINEYIPEQVSTSVSKNFDKVEDFRVKTSMQIAQVKDNTQKEVDVMNSTEKPLLDKVAENTNIEDATKKPITYIKLFLFTLLSFIFTNKIVFYGVLVFIAFLVLRFIYRRIRNR